MSKSIKNFFSFLQNTSIKYFLLAPIIYMVLLVTLFSVLKLFVPIDESFLAPIIAIVTAILTAMIGFILDRQKQQQMELFKQKLTLSEKFLDTLEKILKDNIVSIDKNNPNEDELKKFLFLISKLRIYFSQSRVESILSACTELMQAFDGSKPNDLNYSKIGEALFRVSVIFKEDLDEFSGQKDKYGYNKLSVEREESEDEQSIKGFLEDFIGTLSDSIGVKAKIDETASIKIWHVNIGENAGLELQQQYRCWEDMKTFNFWSAGGGERYALGAQKLKVGDTIYAYISKKGYVGKGIVEKKAELVKKYFESNFPNSKESDFTSKDFFKHLKELTFKEFHDEKIGEYAAKVRWIDTKERKNAYYIEDLKISPLTICSMNEYNLKYLNEVFKEKK